MSMNGTKAARYLRLRYGLALCAIALLATASYLTMQRVVSAQRGYAQLVNLAGHQSGFVNRIAYFGSVMATTSDPEEFALARAQVGRTINKLQRAHRQLTEGDSEAGIPLVYNDTLRIIYEDPMVGLDGAMTRFLERARALYARDMETLHPGSAPNIFLGTYGPHVLEPMLDAAVDEYERIGDSAILRIEHLELGIWIAALLTLLGEAAFVFLPMERRIRASFASLEGMVARLSATRERLLAAQRLADLGDWVWEPQLGRMTWSDQMHRILAPGNPPAPPTPARLRAYAHGKDQAALAQFLGRASTDGTPQYLEHRIRRADGAERIVAHRTHSERNATGQVTRVSGVLQDITERKRSEERIRQLALFDPLTGLANRRLLRERLEQAIEAARRGTGLGAVILLDLDNFKTINDTRGHDVGDLLLVSVSNRLQANVRRTDTVGRQGGDEFVAVLHAVGGTVAEARAQALHIAEALRAALEAPHRLGEHSTDYRASASIGVALIRGTETAGDEPLKQADVALFEAKEAGRNRVCLFSAARQAQVDARTEMAQALRRGLEQDHLRLHYQLQVRADGRPLGAEALLRWLPPGAQPVPADAFIPVAEETGLIHALGDWVLKAACRDLRQLDALRLPADFRLSINLSARQLTDAGFIDRVSGTLREVDGAAVRLTFELTESALMDDAERAAAMLGRLRDLGPRLHLDDFGTGYSSLASLKRLPVDALKLDASLIRDIHTHDSGPAVVRAALALAKSLKLGTVAEGVEHDEQRDFLVQEGCEAFQGFLFGHPMPLGRLAAALGAA